MNNLNGRLIAPILIVFLLLLGGCITDETSEPVPTPASVEEAAAQVEEAVTEVLADFPYAGTSWQVETLGNEETNREPLEGTRLTVNFGLDRYAGSGGCNWFLGGYDMNDEALRFLTPATTMLVCTEPNGVMEQENSFLSWLINVTEYKQEDEKLLAYTVQDQLLMTFVPIEEVPLEGTTWSLKFHSDDDDIPRPAVPDVETTVIFEDGTVSGSAGCNTYQARYEIDGNALTIDVPIATAMACEEPAGIMDQEQSFLTSLQAVTGFWHGGGVLEMMNEEGKTELMMGAP